MFFEWDPLGSQQTLLLFVLLESTGSFSLSDCHVRSSHQRLVFNLRLATALNLGSFDHDICGFVIQRPQLLILLVKGLCVSKKLLDFKLRRHNPGIRKLAQLATPQT